MSNFLKGLGLTAIMIVIGIASCSHRPSSAPDLNPNSTTKDQKFEAALDRNKIELLKRIVHDENQKELEECRANPKRKRNTFP